MSYASIRMRISSQSTIDDLVADLESAGLKRILAKHNADLVYQKTIKISGESDVSKPKKTSRSRQRSAR